MMNCKTAQPLLLDYLFGLLDPEEKQPFETHLEACAACQNALVWAKTRQKLLKSATMESFPEVRFRAEDLLESKTTISRPPQTSRIAISLGVLLAAAALLLILPRWGILFRQESAEGITLAYLHDSGQHGKVVVSPGQIEKTVSEAITVAKSGFPVADNGHIPLSVEPSAETKSELRTIVFVSALQSGAPLEVKSVTLETTTLKPVRSSLDIRYVLRGPSFEKSFSATGMASAPNNQPAKFPDGSEMGGIGHVLFELPREIAGGTWELEVSEARGRFPVVRKKLSIEGFKPEIAQTIRWDKDHGKPGEKARGTVQVTGADGKGIAGAKVTITLIVGGVAWNPETKGPRKAGQERISDENGECRIEFDLPAKPTSGPNEVMIQSRNGESFLSEKYPLPFWR